MAREFPGWIAISAAADKYAVDYEILRRLVRDEVLTRGRFTSDAPGAPIFLRVEELDAFKIGGVEAARKAKAAHEAEIEELHAPDLGNPVG